ncbi:MAG: hypothetical protein KJ734_00235 [Chloroflexi bacterium]|nr:hypothetical protein [Chloroflexota bacterium]
MRVLAIAGLLMEACFLGMVLLRDLRQHTIPFLALYGAAFLGYVAAAWWLRRAPDRRKVLVLAFIVGLAVVFRLTLLFTTPPTLSDDVYRYIWDGRLTNAGVNPYAYAVNSPLLDPLDSPQRALVNNDWMASPYLPAAQVYFAVVYWLAPDSPLAFQIAAVFLDLLTGLLVLDLLRRLGLPRIGALIYLWNPLVVVEFAHGAHVDALMITLMMAALWALVAVRGRLLSAALLAAATLTKGLPALLLPLLVRRWGWRRTALYAALIVATCIPFALGAGWGLNGPLSTTGLFGAIGIYASFWNYNGGLYHWLGVGLSGCQTAGAVSPEVAGWASTWVAKLIVAVLLGLTLLAVWWRGRRQAGDLPLLRWALVPLAAYLLLTTTVHPWYVTLVIPLLPFLLPQKEKATRVGRFLVPGIYCSAIVALSYLTYLDPANLREYDLVRFVEYVPLYLLLVWAAWPAGPGRPGTD